MNPKAALLALHGFRPFMYTGGGVFAPPRSALTHRIKRNECAGEPMLTYWANGWGIASSMEPFEYTEISWSDVDTAAIPDDDLQALLGMDRYG